MLPFIWSHGQWRRNAVEALARFVGAGLSRDNLDTTYLSKSRDKPAPTSGLGFFCCLPLLWLFTFGTAAQWVSFQVRPLLGEKGRNSAPLGFPVATCSEGAIVANFTERPYLALRMKLKNDSHLAYCTYIHRGSSWSETLESLDLYDEGRRRSAPRTHTLSDCG